MELLVGERKLNETNKAVQACNDYLRMGAGRSLQKLLDSYQSVTEPLPPTRRITTLKEWSAAFDWQERTIAYDSEVERQKNELGKIYRREALQTGLALDYERIFKLKELANFLLAQTFELDEKGNPHNIWLPDVKQIGSGKFAERVDIVRFNAAIFEQLRGVLDDLAKETGGRKQKVDVTWRQKLPPGYNPDEVLNQFAGMMALAAQKQNANND